MRLATYIDTLTNAGVEAKLATAHGRAIEAIVNETFITKQTLEALEARLDAKIDRAKSELRADIYQAMFVQALGVVGLSTFLFKILMK